MDRVFAVHGTGMRQEERRLEEIYKRRRYGEKERQRKLKGEEGKKEKGERYKKIQRKSRVRMIWENEVRRQKLMSLKVKNHGQSPVLLCSVYSS